ncbi:MAG: septation protein A [Gammaproteobacteria bacterium]|nr:MAG: septation protein A [Gammaproteobacteria bacterium]
MKLLYDFFPLLLFFAAFKVYGIYTATAVAIAASFIQVGWYWFRHHKFETVHLVSLGVITVFGGLTLLLQDDTFIKWKPTIVYWVLAMLVLGSQFLGKKTAMERLMSAQITLPDHVWSKQNFSWGIFFAALGALNIYVAFYYGLDLDADTRREIWVNFKVFGLLGVTFVFVVIQAIFMSRHIEENTKNKES